MEGTEDKGGKPILILYKGGDNSIHTEVHEPHEGGP